MATSMSKRQASRESCRASWEMATLALLSVTAASATACKAASSGLLREAAELSIFRSYADSECSCQWNQRNFPCHQKGIGFSNPLRGGSDSVELRGDTNDNEAEQEGEIDNPFEYFTRKPLAGAGMVSELLELTVECKKLGQLKRGANEVTKAINRNIAEFVMIAADTEPVELVLHLPLLCEDKGVPFVWVPNMEDLGKAAGLRRSVIAAAVLVNDQSALKDRVIAMRTRVDVLRGDGT